MTDLLRTTQIDDNWARVVRNYKDVGVLPEEVGTDEEVGARLEMLMKPLLDSTASSIDLSEVIKQQIDLAESMGAKAPQELMLVAKQVFYFERYVKGPRAELPDDQGPVLDEERHSRGEGDGRSARHRVPDLNAAHRAGR